MLHAERAARKGGYILAANHLSPFDVALMIRHTPHHLDFMSIVEVKSNPVVYQFYKWMNAFFIDRRRSDPAGARLALERLQRGRVVAMFPEAQIRSEQMSVINGGTLKPGVGHLAQSAGAPIVPCVILGSAQYWRATSWLPWRRTRYGLIYGDPIFCASELSKPEARIRLLNELRAAFMQLTAELKFAMEL